MRRIILQMVLAAGCIVAFSAGCEQGLGQQKNGSQPSGNSNAGNPNAGTLVEDDGADESDVDLLLDRGVERLCAGEIEAALKDLDRVVELAPASEPYLWQRGIAQYFAGKFAEGRKQFEVHRTVNPNDVENATWHFLCVAATDGVQKAREGMLPAPNDFRVPQEEIYKLFKGTGTVEDVDRAVNALPEKSNARRVARFYADLYIGLLAHAEGRSADAKKYLVAAGSTKDQGVMADVARLCRDRLVKQKEDKE